jgi:hypothetical protein
VSDYAKLHRGNISMRTTFGHLSAFIKFLLFRVKFGVPLDMVCKKDIPGPLLVSSPVDSIICDLSHYAF